MTRKMLSGTLLVLVNALIWCVLSFHESSLAAPPSSRQPFGNAVEQRGQMIRELAAIQSLLKEQNSLLRNIVSTAAHAKNRP